VVHELHADHPLTIKQARQLAAAITDIVADAEQINGYDRGALMRHGVAIVGASIAAVVLLLSASPVHADPYCPYCQPPPAPPWNGQLMPTWDTPGYYGGWTTGPVQCDPFALACRGIVPAG
jgi:hypothetical protein